MARATRADVAKRAGVSLSTVSHILNGRGAELGFAPTTITHVETIAHEIGYIPRASARAFRYQSSSLIAVVLSQIPDSLRLPVFNEVVVAAVTRARLKKLSVVPLFIPASEEDPARCLRETLKEVEIVGAIIQTAPHLVSLAPLLEAADIRTVWLDITGFSAEDGLHLGVDEAAGVADMLISIDTSGVTSPVMVTGPGRRTLREAGFTAVFPEAQVIAAGSWLAPSGASVIEDLVTRQKIPDLVFAANDHLAVGCLAALRDHGVDVPGTTQLFGWGDHDPWGSQVTGLSSIYWPLEEVTHRAVDVLAGDAPAPSEPLEARVERPIARPRRTTRNTHPEDKQLSTTN